MLLDMLLTHSRENNHSNIRKTSSLPLRILKPLYPRADWDSVDKGFVMTCTKDEANKLVEDSTVMVTWVIEMLPVDMSCV
jgi:hypothetical protein